MLTKAELAAVQERGGSIDRPEQKVQVPEVAAIMKQFLAMKKEMSSQYEAKWQAKLAKMDELIEAIKGIQLVVENSENSGNSDKALKILSEIQKEHNRLMKQKLEMMRDHDDDEKDEPCTYKVTGRRDQRGLIDLEHGLTFTPVE